jgi:hypothetical protein
MRILGSRRFLIVYSGLLTLAFAVTIFCGFVLQAKRTAFDQIDVQRMFETLYMPGKILVHGVRDLFSGRRSTRKFIFEIHIVI